MPVAGMPSCTDGCIPETFEDFPERQFITDD